MTVTQGLRDACSTLAVQIELIAGTRTQELVNPIPHKKCTNKQTPQKPTTSNFLYSAKNIQPSKGLELISDLTT